MTALYLHSLRNPPGPRLSVCQLSCCHLMKHHIIYEYTYQCSTGLIIYISSANLKKNLQLIIIQKISWQSAVGFCGVWGSRAPGQLSKGFIVVNWLTFFFTLCQNKEAIWIQTNSPVMKICSPSVLAKVHSPREFAAWFVTWNVPNIFLIVFVWFLPSIIAVLSEA